ncbi:MAG: hypothetical protein QF676_08635 [Dehalococcoidia bacterium]|jgi:hypothetical protein|nr:hypothetical protein [Chloroflexota bacterium]MDP6055168.1 hypothetical protein [Dehalococcoidia bacterium]MDP7262645.1 hypothetical protein [Dehalococcoidia bacterium]MDP7486011.1 hypothetical protein [Dehalococcoidia bacterium]|tara:strand:- start:12904 stop:13596 length:693 start_codon:yes stop_codon:yes gene_type:complete
MKTIKQIETPCEMPNGLQWTNEGLFVMDQQSDNVYVVDETGKVLREMTTPTANGSGITVGGGFLWTASNGNSTSRPARSTDTGLGYIYKLDLQTGEPVGRFRTPDGGGIHGIEWDDGKIWVTAFQPLAIYLMDPADNYKIVHSFEVELPRLHGLARVSDGLWCAHTTDNVIVKYDVDSGTELDRISMDEGDAYIHGLSMKDGEFWYADANFAGKHNTATVGKPEIGKIAV